MEKVSVLMGVYNCEDTLDEAIESIINQSYTNWELIICDDGSNDRSYEIGKRYENMYKNKIKVIKNMENLSLGPTLNRCLELATGKYIARQDGDDYSHKDRLKIQIEYMESHPKIDLVGTNMISFDDKGTRGIYSMHKRCYEPKGIDLIKRGTPFAHATILMKTKVIKDLNGYSSKWYCKYAEDYELWGRFLKLGYIGINIDENLYYVRENLDAIKRRGIKRRIRGVILNIIIFKRLKAPVYLYYKVLKDIIAMFIPTKVFNIYYKKKIQNI